MIAFIQLIIDFLKKLFGGGSAPSLPSGASTSHPAGGGASLGASSSEADDDDGGDDLPYAQQQWKELQELIARVERGGVDLAGADWRNPTAFHQKEFAIEQAQADGGEYDQIIRQQGYADRDHHDLVRSYVAAKWSRLGKNDDGEDDVIIDDQYQNAMIQARMGQMQAQMAAKAAANPQLFEPVHGVTIEAYAGACAGLAGLGNGATPQQVAEVLGRHGMDQPTYDAAAAGWQAKMQSDTSYALVSKYGEAFAAAQGMAGGFNVAGGGPSGPEPCTFERFVEIMVAMEAWAQQGMDVNAQLANVFKMNAAEYSRLSSYWSPKMGTDVALVRRLDPLRSQYLAKYAGAAMDDDLSL